ncbi:MAG TPA: hypothetical protein VLE22_10235 [Bryobacteraceae bacterium]|nr:hypothetical protein [Bryobacteraceae bacterium]
MSNSKGCLAVKTRPVDWIEQTSRRTGGEKPPSPRKRLGAFLILIVLGSSVTVRAARGQEISFLREVFNDEPRGVAVDASGVYVVGGGFVRKFNVNGNNLWNRSWPNSAGIVAEAGGVYVVGDAGLLRKYDTRGNQLWTQQIDAWPKAVAADVTGVYVGVYTPGSGTNFVRKYTSNGVELWSRPLGKEGSWPTGMAVDASGVYVVAYHPDPGEDNFVRKYTRDGAELWTRPFGQEGSWAVAVAVEATGIYLVGHTATGRILLGKYDSGGNELWIRQFDSSNAGFTAASGVAADATGAYVVGRTNVALPEQCRSGSQDAFVRKYDANGASLWTRQFSGSSDSGWANGVAAHATGLYVAVGSRGKGLLAKLEKMQPVIGESGPWISPGCVVNAASYRGGRISPGEIVTVFGRRIGPPQATPLRLTEGRRLATELAGTRLQFNGIAAPLLFVSADQISAVVPYAVAEKLTADVEVEYQGVRSNKVTMPVAASRPGVFTWDRSGSGPAAALNEDGRINSDSKPARRGSAIVLYATGEGLTKPVVEDGLILGSVLPKPNLPVSVSFLTPFCQVLNEYDCHDVYVKGEVLYAGGAPESVAGLLQVNVRVPSGVYVDGKGRLWFKLCVDQRCSEEQVNHVFFKP